MDESKQYYSLSGGYRFHPKFHASLQYQNIDRSYEVFENYQRPEDYQSDYLELRCQWDDSNYRFYFQEGISANLTIAQQIGRNDNDKKDVVDSGLAYDNCPSCGWLYGAG